MTFALFEWHFFFNHIFNLSPQYASALGYTIGIAVVSEFLGILLGVVVGSARLSRSRPIRGVAAVYVWLLRGVPELVLMVLLFTGLAAASIFKFKDFDLFGLTIAGNVQAAVVAIAAREGAYMGEIFRNGFQAVDRGQIEAAKALGLSRRDVFARVKLPQAMRVIVPPLGNNFNVTLKVTTLTSVIGVPELLNTTEVFSSSNFRVFELFIGLAINFLLLTTAWSVIQSLIEARLDRHERDTGAQGFFGRLRAHLGGRDIATAGQLAP